MFSITEKQQTELDAWYQIQRQKIDMTKCGAIGGTLTYSFTPTTLGTIVKATNNLNGETIDLSDYDSW
jgi:hypothetical protein